MSVPALDFSFYQGALAAHFRDQAVQVGHINVRPDIADWPATWRESGLATAPRQE